MDEKLNKGKSFWGGIIGGIGGALTAASQAMPEGNVKLWSVVIGIFLTTLGGSLLGVGLAHKVQKLTGSLQSPHGQIGIARHSLIVIMFLMCLSLLIAGCAIKNAETGEWEWGYEQTCTVYEDFGATPENSYIAQYIPDPCAASRLFRVAIKAPAVRWQYEYTAKYWTFSKVTRDYIKEGKPLTFLQDFLVVASAKYNTSVGLTVLLISDEVLKFKGIEDIKPADQAMLLALMDKTDYDMKRMELYFEIINGGSSPSIKYDENIFREKMEFKLAGAGAG